MMAEITKEAYSNWKDSEVTQFVHKMLGELAADRKEYLAKGGTLGENSVTVDFIVGYIQGLNEFLNMQYEEAEDYDH